MKINLLTKKIFFVFSLFIFISVFSTTTLAHAGVIQNIKYFLFGEPTTSTVITTPITNNTNNNTYNTEPVINTVTPPSNGGISENDLYLALSKISRLPDNIISQLRGPQGPKGDTGPKGSSGLTTYSSTGGTTTPPATTIVYTGSSGGSSSSASYWKKDGHDIYYDKGNVEVGTKSNGIYSYPLTIGNENSGTDDGFVGMELIGTVDSTTKYMNNAIVFTLENPSATTKQQDTFEFGVEGNYSDMGVVTNLNYHIYDNYAGQYRFYIDQKGNVGIGTETPDALLDIGVAGAGTNVYGVKVANQNAGINNWNIWSGLDAPIYDPYFASQDVGIVSVTQNKLGAISGLNDGTGAGYGVSVQGEQTLSGDDDAIYLVGTEGDLYHHSTGHIDDGAGLVGFLMLNNGGTASRGSAVWASAGIISDSSVVDEYAGVRIDEMSVSTGGVLTDNYGLKIADQTAGNNNWAIKTGLGDVSFGGNVGIGVNTPTSTLDVEKTLSGSGTGIKNYNDSSLPTSGAIYGIDSETADTGDANNTQVTGYYNGSFANGSGTGKRLYGFYGNNVAGGSVTVANEYGYFNSLGVFGTATVTNSYGAYLDQAYGSHTAGVVNNYGLYVVDHSGIGSNSSYNIYSAGTGLNYFGGNLGIGNTTPSVALDITGDIEYTGTITDVSDRRLKDNIQDYTGALDIINNLQAKSYNMISTPDKSEVGFIAQDVKSIFPNATSIIDPEKGYLGVSYVSLVPVIAQAVKELNLKLVDINKIEEPNSIRDAIVGWFANVVNGIGDMYANAFHAKEKLCINDTCVTEDQLKEILQKTSGGEDMPSPTPAPLDPAPVVEDTLEEIPTTNIQNTGDTTPPENPTEGDQPVTD